MKGIRMRIRMRHPGRTALMMVPLLLMGLSGGVAWSQQGEGRQGDGPRIGRSEGGEERGRRHGHGHEGRGSMFQEHMIEGMLTKLTNLTKLKLTDEQDEKIKSVLAEARKKNIILRANVKVARIELREMISQETPDRAGINAKVDEITGMRGDMLRARTDAALAVREVLTPEQSAVADRILKRLLQSSKGRRHR